MVCKIGFTNWNAKVTLLCASMVVTYYIKVLRTGADRHNGILMFLLLLVAKSFICIIYDITYDIYILPGLNTFYF